MAGQRRLSERIQGAILAALLNLPRGLQRALAGRPIRRDGIELDVSSQLLLRLEALVGGSDVENVSLEQARARVRSRARAVTRRPAPMARVADFQAPGPAGPIPLRAYLPHTAPAQAGLLLYFHGGGHVYGDLDTHDGVCRFLAHQAGVAVLAVDYRLAPEHRFPAAVEDAIAAHRFAATETAAIASALGLGEAKAIDSGRIAVGGDSAGGNLAAAVALAARDGEAPPPAFQLLIYPVSDYSREHASYSIFAEGYRLTRSEMRWFRNHYLPGADEGGPKDEVERRREAVADWRVSPLLAPDLSGAAPAYVATAGFDPLRDEGEAYAHALREAGVEVKLRRFRGLLHSFANQTDVNPPARAAMLEIAAALADAIGEPSAQTALRSTSTLTGQ